VCQKKERKSGKAELLPKKKKKKKLGEN